MIKNRDFVQIEPAGIFSSLELGDIWKRHDLIKYLVVTDFRSNNHGTSLGVLWVLIQPLMMAFIISIVMGYLVKVPSGKLPYPMLVLTGLMIWGYFSNTILKISNSIIANSYLLKKVYFPRIFIPLTPLISNLVELTAILGDILITGIIYNIYPEITWMIYLLVIVTLIFMTFGFGLILSILTVKWRDISNITPVFMQFFLYINPIFYPTDLIPQKYLWIYKLNPLVGLIDASRELVTGNAQIAIINLIYPGLASLVILIFGLLFFSLNENLITDSV